MITFTLDKPYTPDDTTFEVPRCNACGEIDSIAHSMLTPDIDICRECRTVEDFDYVIVNEDSEIVEEGR